VHYRKLGIKQAHNYVLMWTSI